MFLVVSYDIPDDKRRIRIANCLENFGIRVQYSVFECLLDKERLKGMAELIGSLIDEKEDSVRIYLICESCLKRIKLYGIGEISRDQAVYII